MTRFVLTVAFGLTLAIALLLTVGACRGPSQTEPTPTSQAPTRLLGSDPDYYGVAPLEESIAKADVIARVELRSVTTVAEQREGQTTDYVAALDYRFRVLEYLRGSGGNELVAVVT